MSGHSKWAGIKHKKAIVDAKKGKAFTKVASMIIVAARDGGDPVMNLNLRLAIDRAKTVNMPKENIDRAIKRGTGELKGAAFEEIVYEGFGPNGVALLIDIATDNRNRAASEVRSNLTKFGGSLGSSGSVSWMFEKKGQIIIDSKGKDLDEITLRAIDAGADDVSKEEDGFYIYTKPQELIKVKEELEQNGVKVEEASLEHIANNEVKIDKEASEKLIKLVDILEDLDDVVNVTTNAEIEVTY